MAKRIPTLRDLAAESGFSISTVSRALQGHPAISEATATRIRELAAEKGYVANGIARGLKSNNSKTIGVLVPEIRHDFFSSAIEGVEEVAFSKGYTVHIARSGEQHQREVINTQSFSSNRVAGVIASVSQNTKNGDHYRQLLERSVPVVLFDRVLDDLDVDKVVVDDYAAARQAVAHLIAMGYERIAHLAGPPSLKIAEERAQGYRQALLDHDREIDETLILPCELTEGSGAEGMRMLLAMTNPPDAVFAVNDPVAVQAHSVIKASGRVMPQQFGLVGFSNNPITAMMDPPLTTVDQHGYELGRQAARTLLQRIEYGSAGSSPTTVMVNSTLVIRESTLRQVDVARIPKPGVAVDADL